MTKTREKYLLKLTRDTLIAAMDSGERVWKEAWEEADDDEELLFIDTEIARLRKLVKNP
jgi:hypothetical protein